MRFTIILLSLFTLSKAADDESFAAYLLKLYDTEYSSDNRVVLDFKFAALQNDFNSGEPLDLPNSYGLGIYYGFTRKTEKLYYEDFYYHSLEYAFIENRNSRLLNNNSDQQRLNMWSFGFGWADGHSFNLSSDYNVEFVHDISINWTKSYFPGFPNQEVLLDFQDNWRFGNNFRTGLNIPITDNFQLEARHEMNINFNQFYFFPWILSFGVDNALQRLPKLFEKGLVKNLGKSYPIVIWLYKSFISYSVYRLRAENSYWPASGEESLNSSGFSLNFKFLF